MGKRKVTSTTDWTQVVVYPWQLLSNPIIGNHFNQVPHDSEEKLWSKAQMDGNSVLSLHTAGELDRRQSIIVIDLISTSHLRFS
jgi:hypothetical protein